MTLLRFPAWFVLSSTLLVVTTACIQVPTAQTAPVPTHPASPVTKAVALKMLQQQPLHFPEVAAGSPCPTTPMKKVNPFFGIAQGDGPAYATIGTTVISAHAVLHYADAQHFGGGGPGNKGWGGQKVLWFINLRYQGLVLVRGHQLDGPHETRFDWVLNRELLLDTTLVDPTTLGNYPWPGFPSYTRLQAPGCYAYQVDGVGFSYIIIFQAVADQI